MQVVSKVLLIESDPAYREATVRALAPCSVEMTVLNGGKEAMNYLSVVKDQEKPPHLVIFDLAVPEETVEILHQMRLEKSTLDIPVLTLVATAEEKRMMDQFNFPLCFCFLKPLTFGKIIYALPALGMKVNESILFGPLGNFVRDRAT